jgi:hypothetical protein
VTSRILTATVLVASMSYAIADEAPAGPPTDNLVIDATTERVLLDACAYLRSAERLSARYDVTYDDVLLDGTKVQYSRSNRVWMVRPDRLRLDVDDDRGARSVYFDGKSVTLDRPESGLYAVAEAPDNLDAALDLAEQKGISLPLDDLLYSQPCAAFGEHLRTGTDAGLHYLDGDWYHHLLLATDAVDAQLWVAPGDEPVIRKVVITYRDAPGAPQFSALISDWDFTSEMDDAIFTFDPPDGARKVAFRTQGVPQGGTE